MNCARVNQVLDAWLDGELDRETSAELTRHAASCPACSALQSERTALTRAVKDAMPYYRAPAALESRIRASLAAHRRPARRRPSWAAAFALAACAAFLSALVTFWAVRPAPDDPLREHVVASHVASLTEPGRLIAVQSGDRHTVKPWFQGKVDFSPIVKDLADEGFVLAGGRVDHVGDRQAAAVVYRIRSHVINLFVWRAGSGPEPVVEARTRGFSIVDWTEDGLHYAAVSDVDPRDLKRFAALIRGR